MICYQSDEPVDGDHDWAGIIEWFGFSPDLFTVDPTTVRASAWEQRTKDGESNILRAYKAKVVPRRTKELALPYVSQRLKRIKKVRTTTIDDPYQTLVFSVADIQLGKTDSVNPHTGAIEHRGIDVTLDRLAYLPSMLEQKWKDVKRDGAEAIALTFLGDMVEQCSGHYDEQLYRSGLNRTEQMEHVADGFDLLIEAAASFGVPVAVIPVGGNHGQGNRRDNKNITDNADNDDIAIMRNLYRAFDKSGKYENVSWHIPHHELHQTIELSGTHLGLAHGHQFRNYGSQGAWAWWKGQMLGRDAIGSADILISGHYHHLRVENPSDGRVWIQMPALEAGSEYFRNGTGEHFKKGSVGTFLTSGGFYRNLDILSTPV